MAPETGDGDGGEAVVCGEAPSPSGARVIRGAARPSRRSGRRLVGGRGSVGGSLRPGLPRRCRRSGTAGCRYQSPLRWRPRRLARRRRRPASAGSPSRVPRRRHDRDRSSRSDRECSGRGDDAAAALLLGGLGRRGGRSFVGPPRRSFTRTRRWRLLPAGPADRSRGRIVPAQRLLLRRAALLCPASHLCDSPS